MSTLRSLRLLGAVEAGTVTGAQLETYLANAGRASEFAVLLAIRGQSRRMAASPLTMAAVVTSQAAINIVFKAARSETAAACSAVVVSPIAMAAVANNFDSLKTVVANTIAWELFTKSSYYEYNVRTIIALLAELNPDLYVDLDLLISSAISMGDISDRPDAMKAVVASIVATTLVSENAAAMAMIASNVAAITIVAEKTSIMPIIAGSSLAMTEIVSRKFATTKMASYPGSISAISQVASAWASYLAGPYFGDSIALVVVNLVGLSSVSYPTLGAIIDDAAALGLVSKNKQAVQALASNTQAMSSLATSPNIGVILGSSLAMAVIGTNVGAMASFLNASGAWAGLFSSSVAKGYIVASSALVDAIAANAALITYLKTISITTSASGIPDGNATSLQAFTTVPSKVLTLTAKEAGIAATYSPYNFGGTPMTGASAGASISLTSVANLAHVAGYTNMTWNLQGIGVTAATLPIITYVDMT